MRRNNKESKSTKLSRIVSFKGLQQRKSEQTDTDQKHRSFLASLTRRTSKPLSSVQTTSPERSNFTNDNLDNETTTEIVGSPSNPDDTPNLEQPEAMDEHAEPLLTQDIIPSPAMDIQQDSRLLDLPTELRIRIFDYLLKPELPVCLLLSNNVYLWGQGLPKDIASCARVCKQISREVQDIIWERLRFKIRADNGRGLPASTQLGKTETCGLLSRIRHAEICFPIAAIQRSYGATDGTALWRLKLCCAALERNSTLRSLTFNCDTTAFIGEHDDGGVEVITKAYLDVLAKLRDRGVKMKFVNTSLRRNSAICLKIFREGGWEV